MYIHHGSIVKIYSEYDLFEKQVKPVARKKISCWFSISYKSSSNLWWKPLAGHCDK